MGTLDDIIGTKQLAREVEDDMAEGKRDRRADLLRRGWQPDPEAL